MTLLSLPGDDEEMTTSTENETVAMTIHLTPLLKEKKYRGKRGNKDGAIRAFYQLEEEGLGQVIEVEGGKGSSTVKV